MEYKGLFFIISFLRIFILDFGFTVLNEDGFISGTFNFTATLFSGPDFLGFKDFPSSVIVMHLIIAVSVTRSEDVSPLDWAEVMAFSGKFSVWVPMFTWPTMGATDESVFVWVSYDNSTSVCVDVFAVTIVVCNFLSLCTTFLIRRISRSIFELYVWVEYVGIWYDRLTSRNFFCLWKRCFLPFYGKEIFQFFNFSKILIFVEPLCSTNILLPKFNLIFGSECKTLYKIYFFHFNKGGANC